MEQAARWRTSLRAQAACVRRNMYRPSAVVGRACKPELRGRIVDNLLLMNWARR